MGCIYPATLNNIWLESNIGLISNVQNPKYPDFFLAKINLSTKETLGFPVFINEII